MTTLTPGSPVRIEMQKWGGRAHWSFEAVWLGTDRHGTWLGVPQGTPMERPGMAVTARAAQALLVPDGQGWLATFHAPGGQVQVYVDMATPAIWHGSVVRAVDLDLDVIRQLDDSVFIDDEDEFAEHRVSLGYPPEIVSLAEAACADVAGMMRTWEPPFDKESSATWLAALADLMV